MDKRIWTALRGLLLASLVVVLGACASTGGGPRGGPSGTGVVMAIAESESGSTAGSIVGAIGGAIVGSVVGGQIVLNGRKVRQAMEPPVELPLDAGPQPAAATVRPGRALHVALDLPPQHVEQDRKSVV